MLRKYLFTPGALALLCLPAFAPAQALFSDSFDRPDNTDIDADTTGMAGPLAPLTYVEAFEGSGEATSVQVNTNRLQLATGFGMSSIFLDHNLIDADILTAGGFAVQYDVIEIGTGDDQPNRFAGFGVGNTLDEVNNAADINDADNPLRPSVGGAGPGEGVSDFYVDLALDNNLHLWSNGELLATIDVGANTGTVRVNFRFDDFNAGSSVEAEVLFNGSIVATETFTWDNTDTNYLGLSARAPSFVQVDNLAIDTDVQPVNNVRTWTIFQ